MTSTTTNESLLINNKIIHGADLSYSVLQFCEQNAISIPRSRYHRELSIAGNCRMCMVEIKGSIKPVVACASTISKNMHIFTNTQLVKTARENVLEFLLINHPLDCPICDQGGECDSQDQTMIYGSDSGRFHEAKRSVEDKHFGSVVKTVMSRCIHCTRCIRYVDEVIGFPVLGTMGRGRDTEISAYITKELDNLMIGNVADLCPVGASTIKPSAFKARPWELQTIELVDIFDSLCSSIGMFTKGEEIIRILPIRNDTLNREWISDKIRFFYEGATMNRLVFTLMRKTDNFVHCSINSAYGFYINSLISSLQSKSPLVVYISSELDLIESYILHNYCNYLNSFSFYIDQYKKQVDADLRYNWLLNQDLNSLVSQSNLLFINVNLYYESTILDSLLYRSTNNDSKKNIYYIGSYHKNNYFFFPLGN
jgi:NADH dehydrogenase/NADH:ubiquinone oxidoreductase subunit G